MFNTHKKHFAFFLIFLLAVSILSCDSGGSSSSSDKPYSPKEITSFTFETDNNSLLPSTCTGTITGTSIAVIVAYGTDVTGLAATFTTTGATVEVDGTEQISGSSENDFTDEVEYIVTADDGTQQTYTVTVTEYPADAKAIISFSFPSVNAVGTIDESSHTITVSVPLGTDRTTLVPAISHTGVSMTPESGVARDFTSTVTYTVTAGDTFTQGYDVTVSYYEAHITADSFMASGSALSGSASNFADGATLTYTWSEVTSVGVSFGDASSADTTLECTGWDDSTFQARATVTIRLTVSDGTNSASEDQSIDIYRSNYAYVSTVASGDGSAPDSTLGTIQEGINYAEASGLDVVAVTGGTYTVDHDSGTHVQMAAGISVAGGYSADFISRGGTTEIIDSSADPGTNNWADVTCVVSFSDASVTSQTILDGVTLQAHTGQLGMGIYISSGSPTIQNCIITSGNGHNSSGILIDGSASATILDNTISGADTRDTEGAYLNGISFRQTSDDAGLTTISGNTIYGGGSPAYQTSYSRGINMYGAYNVTIDDNTIDSGYASTTYAIHITEDASNISVTGNTITAGTADLYSMGIRSEFDVTISGNTIDAGSSTGTYAIHLMAADTITSSITNNYIDAGSGITWCFGMYIISATPTITGNHIFSSSATRGYGIFESNANSDPLVVTGNHIYDCPQGLYHDNDLNFNANAVDSSGYFTDGTNILEEGNTSYSGNFDTP